MSDRDLLPATWARAALSELTKSMGGGTPDTRDPQFWVDGSIPWVSPKDMKTFKIGQSIDSVSPAALARLTLVPSESVLVVVRSGILSRVLPVAVNTVPVTINQDMRAFVPHAGLDARFLAWQLVSRGNDILTTCAKDGTTVASIEGSRLAGFEIAVAPAAQQQRIVDLMEELTSDLDAAIAELNSAQAKLLQYRQSLLKSAVEGALTAEWRARNPPQETGAELLARILRERRARWEARQLERFAKLGKKPVKGWRDLWPVPASPRHANLCALPVGWSWASLEQVAVDEPYSLSIGPFGSNLKVEDYRSTGVPLVFVRNIRSRRYGGESTRFVTEAKADELAAHSVSAGNVLITKMGEPPGDADVYPADQPLAIITADCIKVRCQPGLVLPEYLAAVINSEIGKSQIQPMTQGVAQKKVSLGRFSKLAVPLPSIAEQAQILSVLLAQRDVAVALEADLVQSLRLAAAQRQNILRAAFSGQLVPQDPADEPASALLARIRAERDGAARIPKPARRPKTKASA